MSFERQSSASTTPLLVVRDGLAARQWEAHLCAARIGQERVWVTPPLVPYRAWRRDLMNGVLADDQRALLTADQSRALWRRVIAESPLGETLLDVRNSARWAADARRVLADWNLDAQDLRADRTQADFAAFLSWHRSYAARLADHGWADEAALAAAAPARGTSAAVTLLDLDEPTPAERDFLRALKTNGWVIERQSASEVLSRARRVGLRDPHEELRAAASWARAALRDAPRSRIAIVVPGLERRLESVRQTALEILGRELALGIELDAPLRTQPPLGSALRAIELSSARASFATFGHWLRSPFLQDQSVEARGRAAMVEAVLRKSIAAQLGFLAAYEQGGLARDLERLAPELAARLGEGLRALRAPSGRATLDVWARAWTQGLARLGWPAIPASEAETAVRAFETALATLAQLTPVLGALTREEAIDELRAVLAAPAVGSLPLYGVHVLAHVDRVGPGYAGIWVAGLTDQSWPEAARTNPLLPRHLQIAHRLPWSTPDDAAERARASQERLLKRAPQVVFSWPTMLYDYTVGPSPLIAEFTCGDASDFAVDSPTEARKRRLESIDDRAPSLAGMRISGGARTLALQARCPIRAFCERRLNAQALETPMPGLGLRGQGIAVHRALEHLLREHPSQHDLRALRDPAVVARFARDALAHVFGAARAALPILFELESARTSTLLARFVASELARPPFRAIGLEERADVEVGSWTITCRIDRIDAAADGTSVLIDYKTGRSAPGAVDWLKDRPTEIQLPLYALKLGASLSGLLTIGLAGSEVVHRGIARDPQLIASSVSALPDGTTWTEQIDRWRTQIGVLVDEFAAGDTRLYLEDASDAQGAYAPLTRVYAIVGAASRELVA